MRFDTQLIAGTLIRRYKRFLADVRLEDGSEVTAHSANTGSMQGCSTPGSRVWLSPAVNPARKTPYDWELVEVPSVSEQDGHCLVGIRPVLANQLVADAISAQSIPALTGYETLRQEVKTGASRIDLKLEDPDKPDCWIEVKSVTWAVISEGCPTAIFPDSPSERGRKHLQELAGRVAQGDRAVMFYCVQRADVAVFSPAEEVDPEYARILREVVAQGVEVQTWSCDVSTKGIAINRPLNVRL